MRLSEFSYRNILSYGNKLQTFKFTDGPKLILVEGENGAGKSSIKEALTVSIYGRSAIRKMKDIPNWINKNAYTNIKFETTLGEQIELDRGIDPNFSNIKINGSVFNLPDKRKVDEFIEEELSKIPFSVFCNTISLSFDDFKSFVNLTKDDKRKIVDRIFGIDILSDMRAKVKESLREIKSESEWDKVGVIINDGASVGAGAICVAPLKIGSWALIGAGSVVIEDVPDYGLVVGNPAKQIGWVGPAGIRLKMVTDNIFECPKSKAKFNLVNGTLHKVEV